MRLRPHPESKPPSRHGGYESRRYRQRQKLLGQALSLEAYESVSRLSEEEKRDMIAGQNNL
jgi:hypothetical protein